MSTTLADVMRSAAAKSHRFTKSKDTDMRRVILQNRFVKDFNNVLATNPLWFTVDDVEMLYSAGTPVAKRQSFG